MLIGVNDNLFGNCTSHTSYKFLKCFKFAFYIFTVFRISVTNPFYGSGTLTYFIVYYNLTFCDYCKIPTDRKHSRWFNNSKTLLMYTNL